MKLYVAPYLSILGSIPFDIDEILTAEDQLKASRFYRQADRDRFRAARVFLYHVMKKKLELSGQPVDLQYNSFGKPYVDIEGLNFNWSHSGNLVALVVGNTECGIDVEEHSKAPLFDYRSICTDEEWYWMKGNGDLSQLEESEKFYQLWTAKESVLKAVGTGLSVNPSEINIQYDSSLRFVGTAHSGEIYYGASKVICHEQKYYSLSWCNTESQTMISSDPDYIVKNNFIPSF